MENIVKITKLETQMEQVNAKLDEQDKKLDTLQSKMDSGFDKLYNTLNSELACYVRKEEFATVKSVVYGMVGAILTAFIGGLIFLIFK